MTITYENGTPPGERNVHEFYGSVEDIEKNIRDFVPPHGTVEWEVWRVEADSLEELGAILKQVFGFPEHVVVKELKTYEAFPRKTDNDDAQKIHSVQFSTDSG